MKITIPEGWQYPGEINWNITNIDDLKIIVDKYGCMHFLERILSNPSNRLNHPAKR